MTNSGPVLTLNNGEHMPAFGLGVFQSPPEQTTAAVETAIAAGYRSIDTAAAYFNEREVGEGIRRSGIERAELWVQTKLWISDYGYERALRAFDASLDRLGVAYVDLYLLHWPMPSQFEATIASYRAAERLLAEGRARAIGVCNFAPTHLEKLITRSEIVPSVNQVELHPFFAQREVRATDVAHGIITQAWSPLGGVNVYAHPDAGQARNPLRNPLIRRFISRPSPNPSARSASSRTSRSSTSPSRRRKSRRSMRSTPASAAAPIRRRSTRRSSPSRSRTTTATDDRLRLKASARPDPTKPAPPVTRMRLAWILGVPVGPLSSQLDPDFPG